MEIVEKISSQNWHDIGRKERTLRQCECSSGKRIRNWLGKISSQQVLTKRRSPIRIWADQPSIETNRLSLQQAHQKKTTFLQWIKIREVSERVQHLEKMTFLKTRPNKTPTMLPRYTLWPVLISAEILFLSQIWQKRWLSQKILKIYSKRRYT